MMKIKILFIFLANSREGNEWAVALICRGYVGWLTDASAAVKCH